MKTPAADPAVQLVELCPRCDKRPELCVCEHIRPLSTKLHVLILQHPQEPDKDLGSAKIAHLSLPNSTLKIGLSWPNIKKALGREEIQSSRWAVLYLGSGIKGKAHSPEAAAKAAQDKVRFVNKTGASVAGPTEPLEGIVVLDGTWSQAKTLWWRNAWLLKLRRVVLTPQYKSLYRELRKEPRRECLSTIESIAESLSGLGEAAEVDAGLKKLFSQLLDKQRAVLAAKKSAKRGATNTEKPKATAETEAAAE